MAMVVVAMVVAIVVVVVVVSSSRMLYVYDLNITVTFYGISKANVHF